ncbi:PemK-like, MazF-like toxin of type II toxin-antitoxin system [Micromonospora kangleipakensis]|uniref:PemK-like, MazF-like toxin of type II toxin-antitoxin system n=1 Tax=Micromonospora kangleipakensis TaxID=1077942 RepID=A0A4Q8B863_9ACTN|nr:type II toxin-antitoxin system PemK/MazF family toxin [Micromonospora kangleipakensis]RZU73857.1 PemK-like, MazF-like toxin of type II toxin-antitoxin system [Micromonospora kangleipakensis]
MPEWVPWAAAIVLAVAAGWLWSEWRRRAAGRPATRRDGGRSGTGPGRGGTRSGGAGTRPGGAEPSRGGTTAPPRPRGADGRPATAPRAGEIWWADVPYADGTGSKVRPCLVLRADDRGADVLKITSQDKSDRDDHVRIPTRSWDADADHDSFLDVSEPIRIPTTAFEDRAGTCDQSLWRQIRRLPHLTP